MKLLNKPKLIKTQLQEYEYAALSWQHIEKAVHLFKNQISQKPIKFDTILVLVRGGMAPAVILAHALDKRDLIFLQGIKTGSNKPHDYQKFSVKTLPKIEKNKKYLIIEDIIFEGDTIFKAIEYVESKQGKVSGVCSLVGDEMLFKQHNLKHHHVPLVCAYQCQYLKWMRFPWERKIKKELPAL